MTKAIAIVTNSGGTFFGDMVRRVALPAGFRLVLILNSDLEAAKTQKAGDIILKSYV